MTRHSELEQSKSIEIVQRERQRVRHSVSRTPSKAENTPSPASTGAERDAAQKSMDQRRQDIASTLFSRTEMQTEKGWSTLKIDSQKATLACQLSDTIADKEQRSSIKMQVVTTQKTSLYEVGGEMVGRINVKDAETRHSFAEAVGTLNHAYFQKLATEDINRYPEHMTERRSSRDGLGTSVDVGKLNYADGLRMIDSLKNSRENRMDIQSNATLALRRDITAVYSEYVRKEENERSV